MNLVIIISLSIMKQRHYIQASLLSLLLIQYHFAKSERSDIVQLAQFSSTSITDITPVSWQPLNFQNIENKTAYFLTRLNNQTVVQAVSHASASALYKKTNISPHTYPRLSWHWQIDRIIKKADITTKNGDDYPARIYVSFAYDIERLQLSDRIKFKLYSLIHDEPPPLAVINYVWDNKSPAGTIVDNAYSDRVKMIVVRSGASKTGKWIFEKRNILSDYRRAFGEDPGNITGIAIMTDTDNTGESATAWYGDITLSKN